MARPGGMIAGGSIAGGESPNGRVVNLNAFVTAAAIEASWGFVGAHAPFTGRFLIARNGDLISVLAGDARSGSFFDQESGEQRIDVVPIRADVRRAPDLHGVPYGDRVFLNWATSSDADVVAYDVFGGPVDGAVSYAAPVATLGTAVVHARVWELPTSGTGLGRITFNGAWTGGMINRAFAVEIVAGGKWRHNLSGSWSTAKTIQQGQRFELGSGAGVTFDSAASAYQTGDSWSLHVGPASHWQSGPLADGTWTWSVKARDAAGNSSAALAERAVEIVSLPDGVLDASVSWDGTNIQLAWTPSDPALDVWVYANYSRAFDQLQEEVIEVAPYAQIAAGETEYEFPPEFTGVWRFYLRPVDAEGRLNESVEMLSVDTEALATSIDLNVPEQVAVVPTAGGTLRVEWAYAVADGGDVHDFAVYEHESSTPIFAGGPDFVVAKGTLPLTGVARYTLAIPTRPGARWYTVRARTVGGVETTNTDVTMGTPDATAPTLAEPLQAVPN